MTSSSCSAVVAELLTSCRRGIGVLHIFRDAARQRRRAQGRHARLDLLPGVANFTFGCQYVFGAWASKPMSLKLHGSFGALPTRCPDEHARWTLGREVRYVASHPFMQDKEWAVRDDDLDRMSKGHRQGDVITWETATVRRRQW